VFESFPVAEDVLGPGLRASGMGHHLEESYPLVLTVVPAGRIRLKLHYSAADESWAMGLALLEQLVARIASAADDTTVGDIAGATQLIAEQTQDLSEQAYEAAWRSFRPRAR
jgi:hypothetical protein